MHKTGLAQSAYQFLTEFKTELLRQIYELNAMNDGVLQDGFNPANIEDGWVSLKGYACGFVIHYDEPVRMDFTVGPDWPFVGYRTTFVGKASASGLQWVGEQRAGEVYYDAAQLARYALRRLASKVGDEWIFNSGKIQSVTIDHDPYYGNSLTGS